MITMTIINLELRDRERRQQKQMQLGLERINKLLVLISKLLFGLKTVFEVFLKGMVANLDVGLQMGKGMINGIHCLSVLLTQIKQFQFVQMTAGHTCLQVKLLMLNIKLCAIISSLCWQLVKASDLRNIRRLSKLKFILIPLKVTGETLNLILKLKKELEVIQKNDATSIHLSRLSVMRFIKLTCICCRIMYLSIDD